MCELPILFLERKKHTLILLKSAMIEVLAVRPFCNLDIGSHS